MRFTPSCRQLAGSFLPKTQHVYKGVSLHLFISVQVLSCHGRIWQPKLSGSFVAHQSLHIFKRRFLCMVVAFGAQSGQGWPGQRSRRGGFDSRTPLRISYHRGPFSIVIELQVVELQLSRTILAADTGALNVLGPLAGHPACSGYTFKLMFMWQQMKAIFSAADVSNVC